jgi:hypothetical protein
LPPPFFMSSGTLSNTLQTMKKRGAVCSASSASGSAPLRLKMASCLLREGRAVIQFCTPASLNLKIHFCVVPIFWVVEDSMTRMGVVGRMQRNLAFER